MSRAIGAFGARCPRCGAEPDDDCISVRFGPLPGYFHEERTREAPPGDTWHEAFARAGVRDREQEGT